MKNRKAAFGAIILFGFYYFNSQQVFASGYEIAELTARGLGVANALTAGVDDPSAVFMNPAALTEIVGNQIMAGGVYVNSVGRVRALGQSSKNTRNDALLPSLFANYHIPDSDFVLGIGGYAPFGLATDYKETSFTRFAALRSELRTLYVTPSIAWKPTSFFSVGAGVSLVHSSAELSQAMFLGALGVGEGRLRITDSDQAFAYNLGFLIRPHERVKVGITYRSRVDLSYNSAEVSFSDAQVTGGASSKTVGKGIHVPIPPVVVAGIQWKISPDWTAEVDYKFTRWSEFENFRVRFASPLPALGGVLPISALLIPQHWKNTSSVRMGASYKMNEQFELRGGISLDQSPIPDKSLSPAIPSANLLGLNSGLGYTWKKFDFDLGYIALFSQTRRVANNVLEGTNITAYSGGVALPPATPPGLAGRDKYQSFHNLVALHARYRF